MLRFWPLIAALLVLGCEQAPEQPEPQSRPLVIAHRGASGYLPEHSLAAKALALGQGADYLEQDVVLSADGVPMVWHDLTLGTMTDVAQHHPKRARADGKFYLADFTAAELKALKVQARSARKGQPQRFPTGAALFRLHSLLEEIQLIEGLNRTLGKNAGLYVELKAPAWHLKQGLDLSAAVLKVLEQTGYASGAKPVYIQSFESGALKRLKGEFNSPLKRVQLLGENDWFPGGPDDYTHMQSPEGLKEVAQYAHAIGPWLAQVRPGPKAPSGLIEAAHQAGLSLHVYTLAADRLPPGAASFEPLIQQLARWGVDGFFTDHPDQALRALKLRPVAAKTAVP